MPKTAEDVAGEAYQVIGSLAATAGIFNHLEVQRALDYFSGDLKGEILPFVLSEPEKADPAVGVEASEDTDIPTLTAEDFARARPATEVFSAESLEDFRSKRDKKPDEKREDDDA
ncbi:hypothetical protein GGQ87_000050 [Brevundimonas alba]|uniref:Uncharacterized protein n=1 Tax=Brevundimonas alba TaxID=74314 RepID=A0A7X5YH26_9CAUL|nr:hypothetical protein [Brevundimonas alba]NJC39792.1 hypothetical protein [Brevundimonas alba]